MATLKKLVATTGEYEKDGAKKKNYETAGFLKSREDGSQYIVIKKCFSPAGVMSNPSDPFIYLNFYDMDDKKEQVSGLSAAAPKKNNEVF